LGKQKIERKGKSRSKNSIGRGEWCEFGVRQKNRPDPDKLETYICMLNIVKGKTRGRKVTSSKQNNMNKKRSTREKKRGKVLGMGLGWVVKGRPKNERRGSDLSGGGEKYFGKAEKDDSK